MTYQEYLKTAHWINVRKRALEYAKHKCQICSCPKKLQVHHNYYGNLWEEKDSDLIVLCDTCHKKYHDIKNERSHIVGKNREGKYMIRRFLKLCLPYWSLLGLKITQIVYDKLRLKNI